MHDYIVQTNYKKIFTLKTTNILQCVNQGTYTHKKINEMSNCQP